MKRFRSNGEEGQTQSGRVKKKGSKNVRIKSKVSILQRGQGGGWVHAQPGDKRGGEFQYKRAKTKG